MSAKIFSRAFGQGQIKKLQRMKASENVLRLPPSEAPRNPVAYALTQRRLSSGAGKHIRSQGAERRAQKMALKKVLQDLD